MRYGKPVSSAVLDRASRGKGLAEDRDRLKRMRVLENRCVFQMQSTDEVRAGKRTLEPHEGYSGFLEEDDGELRIIDAFCSCPDFGTAKLPNGVGYCKHVACTKLLICRHDYGYEAETIKFECDAVSDGFLTLAVIEDGKRREPSEHEKFVRPPSRWLIQHGYRGELVQGPDWGYVYTKEGVNA